MTARKKRRPGRPKLDRPAYERMLISVPATIAEWIRKSATTDECSLGDVVEGCVLAMQEQEAIDRGQARALR